MGRLGSYRGGEGGYRRNSSARPYISLPITFFIFGRFLCFCRAFFPSIVLFYVFSVPLVVSFSP